MHIVDDSGAEVPAPALRGGVLPDPDHPATRAMFARLVDRMFGESRGCLHLLAYGLLVPFFIFGSCIVGNIIQLVFNAPAVAFIVWLSLVVGASYLLVRLLTPNMASQLAHGMRHVGRCGSCCHPLVHAPDAQGLTRCAECGAAWQSSTIVEVRVPDADRGGAGRFRKTLTHLRSPKVRFRDRRHRFVLPRWPAARWLRGTPHASAGRVVRWTIIALWCLTIAITVGAILLVFSTDGRTASLIALAVSFLVCVVIGAFGPPLLLIHMLSRRGVCPACINPLEPERWCRMCGCVWGSQLPPAPPPAPSGSAHPPIAPPSAPSG